MNRHSISVLSSAYFATSKTSARDEACFMTTRHCFRAWALATSFGLIPLSVIAQVQRETTVTTFTPEVRTEVVRYFEPFAEEEYGLPPEVVNRVKVTEMPRTWSATRIEPGIVIEEELRSYLIKPPAKLVTILPEPKGYQYYIAGSNVVAVDSEYKVIDSFRIPSVKYELATAPGTAVTAFTPEVRTKVVRYFEPFAQEEYGLPPEVVTRVKVTEIPRVWRTARIEPGIVIEEEYRPYLVSAPPKLVTVLPEPAGYKYYLAGSNVVAVDSEYRVLDSFRIPSIRYRVETEE